MKVTVEEITPQGMDWIHLAQDKGNCRGLVNTVMNLPDKNIVGLP
jgi:hypothetical protein